MFVLIQWHVAEQDIIMAARIFLNNVKLVDDLVELGNIF